MNSKRYTLWGLGLVLLGLTAVAAFNALVDPAGAYPALHLASFHHQREGKFHRVARAELARRGDWTMAVFGTSRSKAGMPAAHPWFGTNRTCNLSVDAASMSESLVIFDYARARNPLRRVLLCLDFFMFRQNSVGGTDFADSRFNAALPKFEYHAKLLLGAGATEQSGELLGDRWSGKLPPAAQTNGFLIRTMNPGTAQRALFEKVFRSLAYGYATQKAALAELEAFRQFVRTCREQGIELALAINPTHALDLELIRAGGNWPAHEQWRRDLVRVLAEEQMTERAALWDFGGYSGPPTEAVPPAGDTRRMTFYFENSHYTLTTGALMLDRLAGNGSAEFGVQLTPANIESHLRTLQEQRERYVQAQAEDVAWAQRVAKEMLQGRRAPAAEGE